MKPDAECKDIARQLIEDEPGRKINVLMGGGLRSFLPNSQEPGRRIDEKNLTDDWMSTHKSGEFVADRSDLLKIHPDTEHVLGIFAPSHLNFNADHFLSGQPSLSEMTEQALKILKRNNSNGFILVVEGGNIDIAHHNNIPFKALDDTLAFDEAVRVAVRNLGEIFFFPKEVFFNKTFVDLTESLIIVTADHASSVVYSGYATPKADSILGMDRYVSNVSKKPYQLLTYSSGRGHYSYNETLALKSERSAIHQAAIASTFANHAGDDVPLYAVGPLSNILFSGSLDQTFIPHAIAFAMCLFDHQERCQRPLAENNFESARKPSRIQLLREKLQSSLGNFSQLSENATDENSKSEKVSNSVLIVVSLVILIQFIS